MGIERPRRDGRRAAPRRKGLRLARALALFFALALLAGCLDEAADKDFDFDNPLDDTPAGGGGDETGTIAIAAVIELNDIVVIVNQSATDGNLDSWTLENTTGTFVFTFPTFTLAVAQFVRAHTNDTTGTDTASDLFAVSGNTVNWGLLETTSAVLRDSGGNPVAECSKGNPCWP